MIQKTGSALVALSVYVILFCPSMAIYAFFYLVLVNPRKQLSLSDCLLNAHVRCFHVSAESTQNHPTVAQSPILFLQSTAITGLFVIQSQQSAKISILHYDTNVCINFLSRAISGLSGKPSLCRATITRVKMSISNSVSGNVYDLLLCVNVMNHGYVIYYASCSSDHVHKWFTKRLIVDGIKIRLVPIHRSVSSCTVLDWGK